MYALLGILRFRRLYDAGLLIWLFNSLTVLEGLKRIYQILVPFLRNFDAGFPNYGVRHAEYPKNIVGFGTGCCTQRLLPLDLKKMNFGIET